MENKVNEYYDAFISYRHETGFYMAQIIYDKLVYNGYSVFLDKNLHRGEYEEQLHKALNNSRNYIVVLFPGDLETQKTDDIDWLEKEAEWATANQTLHIIPVFCDGFTTKNLKETTSEYFKKVLKYQSVTMHKDYSLDNDLDKLCDMFLQNVNPVKPMINTTDFFKYNLNRKNLSVKRIDMAFHGGGSWRRPEGKKAILDEIVKRNIPVRIIINTPEAAESIAKHMRDDEADYISFENLQNSWKKYVAAHRDIIEIRICSIPLIHIYHAIEYDTDNAPNSFNRIHVKYYVYKNLNLSNSFEHEMSSFSKYYDIYKKEFEYLWEQSEPLI